MKMLHRFAVLLCLILLFDECFSKFYFNPIYNDDYVKKNGKVRHAGDVSFKRYHGDNLNEKKWVSGALLTLGVLSAGFDIYKQEAGCKPTNPKLFSNVDEANKKQKIGIGMRDQLNLAWSPIYNAEGYLQRLGSEMVIMRTHIAKIDVLQASIIELLDQKIFTRLDRAKRQIENDILVLNGTKYMNPDVLIAKFFTKLNYALSIAFKLTPIALWLGSKTLGPYITKSFSKAIASDWVSKSNNVVTRMIKNYQSKGLFPNLKARWSNFVKSSPIIQGIKTRLTFSPKVQAKLTRIRSGIVSFGKFAVVGLFAAYEIYNGIKFFKSCDQKEDESKYLLKNITESIANMTKLRQDMEELKNETIESYATLYENLVSTPFLSLVTEIREMVVTAQFQNETSVQVAKDLKIYLSDIASPDITKNGFDFAKVESLTTTLNTALLRTAYQLECYRRKLLIISTIAEDCASGKSDSDALWNRTKALEGQTLENCIVEQNYLNKQQIIEVVGQYMIKQNKSPYCLRNNEFRQTIVCGEWHNYKNQTDIQTSYPELTLDDIIYFTASCPPGEVSDAMHAVICLEKENNRSVEQVIAKLSRHDKVQIKSVYQTVCNLTSYQKTGICKLKLIYKTLSEVQATYPHYDDIEPVYNSCQPDITKICLFSTYVSFGNVSHSIHEQDVAFFGVDVIENVLNNKCSKKDYHTKVSEDTQKYRFDDRNKNDKTYVDVDKRFHTRDRP